MSDKDHVAAMQGAHDVMAEKREANYESLGSRFKCIS